MKELDTYSSCLSLCIVSFVLNSQLTLKNRLMHLNLKVCEICLARVMSIIDTLSHLIAPCEAFRLAVCTSFGVAPSQPVINNKEEQFDC